MQRIQATAAGPQRGSRPRVYRSSYRGVIGGFITMFKTVVRPRFCNYAKIGLTHHGVDHKNPKIINKFSRINSGAERRGLSGPSPCGFRIGSLPRPSTGLDRFGLCSRFEVCKGLAKAGQGYAADPSHCSRSTAGGPRVNRSSYRRIIGDLSLCSKML